MLLTMCYEGTAMDDFMPQPPPQIERRARPRVSLVGIATGFGMAASILTLVFGLWQGARYFNSIDYKLDVMSGQVAAVTDMKRDIIVLQTQMNSVQAWLQAVAAKVDSAATRTKEQGPP